MAITDAYRKQHDELLGIVLELSKKLSEEYILTSTDEILRVLAQFISKLNIHLTMEDKALYPKLLASGNAKVSETAMEFMTEMGWIKQAVEKYIFAWSSAKSIIGNPSKFIDESQKIILALRTRIEKENNILYPLAETL